MPPTLADRARTIAKQTLLGVIALLALVIGATVALAEPGETEDVDDTTTTTTVLECDGDAEESTTDPTAVDQTIASGECTSDETTTTTEDQTDGDEDDEAPEETVPDDTVPDETDTLIDPDEVGDDGFRNHGEAVSTAAREDCEPGPGHGACVSEVAKSDAGKHASDEGEDDDEDRPEAADAHDSAESPGDEGAETESEGRNKGKGAAKGKK